MVLIPLGRKLVVLNFYHSSLELLKHMTNIRERIMETLTLPKIEAIGGIMPGEIPDELTISTASDFGEIDSYQEPAFENSSDEITISPTEDSSGWTTSVSTELPPPDGNEPDMLQPDSFGYDDYPEPPPPPAGGDEMAQPDDMSQPDEDATAPDFYNDDSGDSDDVPPPPPPPDGSYGDGTSFGDDSVDDDYSGGGSEVSF